MGVVHKMLDLNGVGAGTTVSSVIKPSMRKDEAIAVQVDKTAGAVHPILVQGRMADEASWATLSTITATDPAVHSITADIVSCPMIRISTTHSGDTNAKIWIME